ncbi:hypothetical protein FOA43_003723 [Brettanomyces nanus]|uniref:Pre-mRNA-processing factor 17 n=1 Tax=Eeniella nana TaxID=13502 RepID=A0A875RWJ2_EENNA|nr:uncharacterized protein FOA43_003723 [Brettanomyces nanus]QPG76337.1 hypothetical protein FOA43_003723 [Brettanomyces nanus]
MSIIAGYSSSSSEDESEKQQLTTLPMRIISGGRKTITGYIQQEAVDPLKFDTNKRLYDRLDGTKSPNNSYFTVSKRESQKIKRQRKDKGDSSQLDGNNAYRGPWASEKSSSSDEESDRAEVSRNYTVELPPDLENGVGNGVKPSETSEYFPTSTSSGILTPPSSNRINFLNSQPGAQKCYVPKKKVYIYTAHRGGVQAIQFLPNTGHLLLSCGNDSEIKIWDVYGNRELLRGYYGHTKAVKNVQFNSDGTKFLSCSYDKWVKLWDTETGKCTYKKKLRGFPSVAKFNPNNQNEFLVGTNKMTVEHYDISADEIIQTYEHHTGAINYLEFIAENKNFVTSSEDKSLKVWDLRINMPIKQIADPKQHSMPYLRLHPDGRYFVAQSMDNTIVTFSTKKTDKFRKNKRKLFKGHNSAGYSVGLQFSPDGRNLISGDSYGYTYFWDWNTTRLIKKIKVDDKVISCVDAHPLETSIVAMAGLSGNIYLYD